jgi:hypothetical protein
LNVTASEKLVDSARHLVVEEVRVRSAVMRAVEVAKCVSCCYFAERWCVAV